VSQTRCPFLADLDHRAQPRPPTPASTDMDMREAFSRLRKKIPRSGSKRKPDRTGADTSGERADAMGSPPPSDHHLVVGGGQGRRASTDGWLAHLMDRPQQTNYPEPVPARVSETDRGGREAGVDGGEISQRHRVGPGSRPSRDGKDVDTEGVGRVYLSPSTPSDPHSGKPNSTRTRLFHVLPLIAPSENVGASTIPDRVQPSATVDEDGLNWKSGTRGLSSVLGTCKVRTLPHIRHLWPLHVPLEDGWN